MTEAALETVRRNAVHRSFTLLLLAGGLGLIAGSIPELRLGRYSVAGLYLVVFFFTCAMARAERLH